MGFDNNFDTLGSPVFILHSIAMAARDFSGRTGRQTLHIIKGRTMDFVTFTYGVHGSGFAKASGAGNQGVEGS